VNNAGIGLSASIEDTTEEAFDELMRINLKAPFFLIREALPRLRDEGRILNLSSAVTRISLPVIPAYSMSKGAVNALTLSLASQLGPRGITINAIQPGFVATDMNAGMLQDPGSRQFGADYSIFGRWGEPADVADIAAFLASPDSRWITGQCIDASGGSHL
jgi:NAD(P)-dependent dehydrogenase (short-subunit alcohol dehydrogenase family)